MATEASTSCWTVHFGDVLNGEFTLFKKVFFFLAAALFIVTLPAAAFMEARSLGEKATDPTAILTQFQFQNVFIPSNACT